VTFLNPEGLEQDELGQALTFLCPRCSILTRYNLDGKYVISFLVHVLGQTLPRGCLIPRGLNRHIGYLDLN
jgi:hypothetical protein